jgi:hypothetical protein
MLNPCPVYGWKENLSKFWYRWSELAHHWGCGCCYLWHVATSVGKAGLSIWHLPRHTWGSHRVLVRCENNFESSPFSLYIARRHMFNNAWKIYFWKFILFLITLYNPEIFPKKLQYKTLRLYKHWVTLVLFALHKFVWNYVGLCVPVMLVPWLGGLQWNDVHNEFHQDLPVIVSDTDLCILIYLRTNRKTDRCSLSREFLRRNTFLSSEPKNSFWLAYRNSLCCRTW